MTHFLPWTGMVLVLAKRETKQLQMTQREDINFHTFFLIIK